MIRRMFKNQRGDTIVEVTLALTVLALVLGTSSVLANRNTKTLQNAQEKNVAVRYAQQQIEFLKTKAVGNIDVFTPYMGGGKFCMTSADSNPVPLADATCKLENGGAKYTQTITLQPAGDGIYNAKANVEWETLTSWMDSSGNIQNKGNVQLTYRIYSKLGPTTSPTTTDCGGSDRVWSAVSNGCINAPKVVLSASPTTVVEGQLVTLTWTGQHVSICEAEGSWSGGKGPSGTVTFAPSPSGSYPYKITCSNAEGIKSSQSSVTVNVEKKPPARTPLHRCYQFWHGTPDYKVHTNHHYSTDRNFCDGNGYGSGQYEGVAGWVPLSSNPGVIPVYAAYSGANSSPAFYDTFYTNSYWEYSSVALPNAHNNAGGVVFYVYPYAGSYPNEYCTEPGTVLLRRYWSDFVGNHFYSINQDPNTFAAADGGGSFARETSLGCIFNKES